MQRDRASFFLLNKFDLIFVIHVIVFFPVTVLYRLVPHGATIRPLCEVRNEDVEAYSETLHDAEGFTGTAKRANRYPKKEISLKVDQVYLLSCKR
jgi:hypothetical protein